MARVCQPLSYKQQQKQQQKPSQALTIKWVNLGNRESSEFEWTSGTVQSGFSFCHSLRVLNCNPLLFLSQPIFAGKTTFIVKVN